MKYSKCKCGSIGTPEPVIECSMRRWRVFCPECGNMTQTYITKESAIKAWNEMNPNFPQCESCYYFKKNGHCDRKDTMTKATWTCPEHAPKDDIEEYTHTHNKNLLDAHFGASADELLQGLTIRKEPDYKAEFLKLEKDYFEDIADLKQDLKTEHDKAVYWFEKYSEEQENSTYWYKEWQKASQENEKLNMLIAKIKEIVEG